MGWESRCAKVLVQIGWRMWRLMLRSWKPGRCCGSEIRERPQPRTPPRIPSDRRGGCCWKSLMLLDKFSQPRVRTAYPLIVRAMVSDMRLGWMWRRKVCDSERVGCAKGELPEWML